MQMFQKYDAEDILFLHYYYYCKQTVQDICEHLLLTGESHEA